MGLRTCWECGGGAGSGWKWLEVVVKNLFVSQWNNGCVIDGPVVISHEWGGGDVLLGVEDGEMVVW